MRQAICVGANNSLIGPFHPISIHTQANFPRTTIESKNISRRKLYAN